MEEDERNRRRISSALLLLLLLVLVLLLGYFRKSLVLFFLGCLLILLYLIQMLEYTYPYPDFHILMQTFWEVYIGSFMASFTVPGIGALSGSSFI
jgi:hypothetical protein